MGGLVAVLERAFPEHSWEKTRFNARGGKKATQRMLHNALQDLFHRYQIYEDFTYASMEYSGSFSCCSRNLAHIEASARYA
jgi:hypothetical protein